MAIALLIGFVIARAAQAGDPFQDAPGPTQSHDSDIFRRATPDPAVKLSPTPRARRREKDPPLDPITAAPSPPSVPPVAITAPSPTPLRSLPALVEFASYPSHVVEVHKDVPRDTEVRVRVHHDVAKSQGSTDCGVVRLPELTMETPPSRGTVRFATTSAKAQMCANDTEATGVFYKPAPGFVGEDQFRYKTPKNVSSTWVGYLVTIRVTVR